MKKLISLTAFLLCIAVFLKAQDMGHVVLGVKGGYNYSLSYFNTNKTLPVKPVHGGYVGAMLKIPFDNRLFFAPQIDVSYRGMKTDSLQKNQYSSISEFHLRIQPLLQLNFKKPESKSNTLFVHFGPSIGFGITGKQIKQDAANNPVSGTLKYGFTNYGRYDAHWHTGIGYETTGGLRLLLEYAHGLGNMINTDGGALLKYRNISLGIGYWLGKK
jgi:Outer membrane protein beta-barrel domain